MTGEVIYDFGMNNGDDVEYYLLKAARVVGVEANPALCEAVRVRFAEAIGRRHLVILNVALSDRAHAEPIKFYVHKDNHVLSQLPRPAPAEINSFEEILVPARTPCSIIQEFGAPMYLKVDVEHFDGPVLRDLFANGIRPPDISAESHSAEIFALLVANGYRAFNLVEGRTVAEVYGNAEISTMAGKRNFGFRHDSSGPFGDDLVGNWEDEDTFLYTLAAAGLGWRDIHASNRFSPGPKPPTRDLLLRLAAGVARRAFAGIRRRVVPASFQP